METPKLIEKIKRSYKRISPGYRLSIVITFILAVGIIFHITKISALKSEYSNRITQIESDNAAFYQRQTQTFLHDILKPTTWAIRAELLRNNDETVIQYLSEFVHLKEVEEISVIMENKIKFSSNRKNEGVPFVNVYDKKYLNKDEILIDNVSEELIICVAPIMGYDRKLGMIIVQYKPVNPQKNK
jgi:hypothetical protein